MTSRDLQSPLLSQPAVGLVCTQRRRGCRHPLPAASRPAQLAAPAADGEADGQADGPLQQAPCQAAARRQSRAHHHVELHRHHSSPPAHQRKRGPRGRESGWRPPDRGPTGAVASLSLSPVHPATRPPGRQLRRDSNVPRHARHGGRWFAQHTSSAGVLLKARSTRPGAQSRCEVCATCGRWPRLLCQSSVPSLLGVIIPKLALHHELPFKFRGLVVLWQWSGLCMRKVVGSIRKVVGSIPTAVHFRELIGRSSSGLPTSSFS